MISGERMDLLSKGALILNARVQLEPDNLEKIVRETLAAVADRFGLKAEIDDLQCFSPAYPNPPHMVRETLGPDGKREEDPS
jgi:hypothetical protein